MIDAIAEDCLRLQSQMESDRGTWEGHWREVAELVRPNQNFFQRWWAKAIVDQAHKGSCVWSK